MWVEGRPYNHDFNFYGGFRSQEVFVYDDFIEVSEPWLIKVYADASWSLCLAVSIAKIDGITIYYVNKICIFRLVVARSE